MVGTSGTGESWRWQTIVRTMFPMLLVLVVIVLFAGIRLEEAEVLLERYPILSVMVPTMVAMGGNLGAILSARLTTRFHLGTTTLDPRDRVLWANVLAILALAATLFTALAAGAAVLGLFIDSQAGIPQLFAISLLSGFSLALIAIAFSFGTTYASYRLGIDPDDTTIPIVTNVVDVFGMVIFLGVSRLILG
ncbi:magnesium transporter [Halovenus salina]|uniref:Magnesium transporter n=1 Tax=Halovenus salina TaxID=1510225 RepID=A0ABD5W2J4_9EURY|nr:magnesium transporter [Halovenus salina]